MPKTVDVPVELRDFNKIFERLCYRHQYTTCFHDLLQIFVCEFGAGLYRKEYDETIKRYDEKELICFGELFREMVNVMNKQITTDDSWYDMYGTFYGVISSQSKAQAMGQFFTPASVCDMIAKITHGDAKPRMKGEKMLTIGDPCSGSGRMLLAFNAHAPGHRIIAEDRDHVCCLMTVMNMVMHGCVGEVVWHDSLDPDSWYGGWNVNPILNETGFPSVAPLLKENSFVIRHWQNRLKEIEAARLLLPNNPDPVREKKPGKEKSQLTLF